MKEINSTILVLLFAVSFLLTMGTDAIALQQGTKRIYFAKPQSAGDSGAPTRVAQLPFEPGGETGNGDAATQEKVVSTDAPAAPQPDGAADADESDSDEDEEEEDLFDMDLEDLGQIDVREDSPDPVFEAESLNNEVMSVDGTKSTVGQSPAAVYVLTTEMIRRSGVRTVPDALRLVPGVQVSQLNSQDFSVAIRGFGGTFNNKVLAQIDGRAIYNSTYGGVMWDINEIILEDIERIEVIRGPGATVWGENAVNGIINIVTKRSEDTIGNYFTSGGGTLENEFHAFSIGRSLGDLNYRVYGKYNERNPGLVLDPFSVPGGFFPEDGGFLGRVGLRSDYLPTDNDRITTFFDLHRGGGRQFLGQEVNFDPTINRTLRASGGYGMLQWRHKFHEDRDMTVQAFYDRTNRDWIATTEKLENYELDIKHRRQINPRRERVSGLTYRYSKGRYFGPDFAFDSFGDLFVDDPYQQLDRLDIEYFGGFVQEKWTLKEDKLFAWLGSKVSWNSLNGVNAQPSARMLYVVDDSSVVWGSISRAVRLPTRFDAGIQLEDPDVNLFAVEPTARDLLVSESVVAHELGYRKQVSERFNWELTGFYNEYFDLLEQGPLVSYFGPFLPAPLDQLRADGHAYGAELNGEYRVNDFFNLRAGYSYLNLDIDDAPGDPGVFGASLDNDRSPDNMFYLQSLMQLTCRLQWDTSVRYVDRLQNGVLYEFDPASGFNFIGGIPSYVQLDTRLNYRITDRLDFTIVGRNLLNSAQSEFGGDEFFQRHNRSYLRRNVFFQLGWKTGRVPQERETAMPEHGEAPANVTEIVRQALRKTDSRAQR